MLKKAIFKNHKSQKKMAMLKKSSIFGLLKNAFHMIFIYVKTHVVAFSYILLYVHYEVKLWHFVNFKRITNMRKMDLSRKPHHCHFSLIFSAALDSTDK